MVIDQFMPGQNTRGTGPADTVQLNTQNLLVVTHEIGSGSAREVRECPPSVAPPDLMSATSMEL